MFKIKAFAGQQLKEVEVPRGATFSDVNAKLEAKFGHPVGLTYKKRDGNVITLKEDAHLNTAVQDCITSGAKFVRFEVIAPVRVEPPKPVVTPTPVVTPVKTPASPTPVTPTSAASTGSPAFCGGCGVKLVPGSKFCFGCGAAVPGLGAAPPASPANVPPPAQPATGAPPRPAENICGVCNLPVVSGVRALDRLWHMSCFVCTGCKGSLSGGFQAQGGLPYCGTCFTNQFCEKCAMCQRPISGSFVKAGSQQYHAACFVCSVCHKPPEGKYRMKGTQIICGRCPL